MAVLVVADVRGGLFDEAIRKVVTSAIMVNSEVDILLAGEVIGDAADEAAKISGVRKVLYADDPVYAHQLSEPLSELILAVSETYEAVLMAAGAVGKGVMPRVAALLDVMQISEIVAVQAPDVFVRPIYAGNALMTLKSNDPKKIITVRTTAFDAADMYGNAAVEKVCVEGGAGLSEFVSEELSVTVRPELTSAKIVISGGRALNGAENFEKYIFPIADKLGAAVGASRAAVDAGYVPNDYQVGQTGKVVAPELYIAVGISGAIQHLAGMKDSKVIVAINTDEEAPIFQVADYGLVGDLFEVLPKLNAALS